MSIVKRINVNLANSVIVDKGIEVLSILELIENTNYHEELFDLFNVENYAHDFIEIKGAEEVVRNLIKIDEEYQKFDVDSYFKNVKVESFIDEKEIILEINNIKDPKILKITGTDMIYVETRYAVRSEYFNELYNIDKYLDFCKSNRYDDIVKTNITMLEEKNKNSNKDKKFRLLKSKDGKYFVRALTSTEVYKDYNLRFSLFIALIELHKLNKYKGHSYYINSYSFTESDAKIVFSQRESFELTDKMKISFALELVNDEIKREAVKLNGIFTISLGNGKDIFVRPDDVKTNIVSFSHSVGIEKVKEKLENLAEKIDVFTKNMIDDTQKIKNIQNPNTIREFLLYKIQKSRTQEISSLYKADINKLLTNNVDTIFQLFEVFNKIDLLIDDEHIVAKDFWRHKLYQALVEGGKDGSK